MVRIKHINKFLMAASVVTMGFTFSYAQTGGGYYNQAENLFKAKEYYEASQVYEKYLATERTSRPHSTPFAIEKKVKGKANVDPHEQAVYNLATSYRMINDYQKAEKYYKESVGFSDKAYPDARYWYAVTLRANKEYGEALAQIDSFLEKHTQMDDLLTSADREMESLKFIQQQSERVNDQFTITEMKGTTAAANYAMTERNSDTVVFTSITEEKSKEGRVSYMNTLFESPYSENPLTTASPMNVPSEEGMHDGMASFTQDGRAMLFTRWTKKNNQTNAAIYISRQTGKRWSAPIKATSPVNMDGSNSAQPYLTSDGHYVIFSSDRPGGLGGYDLWAASLDSNLEPIEVRNLGNVINTTGDEEAPYFHDKTRTLVFSSNGRVGMGGFDIYYALGNFNLSSWEKPENAGAPLNSTKDDIYYVGTDDENLWNTGWISSDRSSECCLALFSVKSNNTQYVNGTVVDCETHKPLTNTVLTITDLRHPDRMLGKYKADTTGHYAVELHNSAHFKISATQGGYEPVSLDYNLAVLRGKDSMVDQVLCLKAIRQPKPDIQPLLNALERSSRVGNFAYKKAILNDSAHDNLDSLAIILKQHHDMVIQIEGYTDGIGGVRYNLALAQKRVDACIRYLVNLGVPSKQIIGKAMGKCCPIEPDTIDGKDNPAGRAMNRRVEYQMIKD